jgi:hypothetical protein
MRLESEERMMARTSLQVLAMLALCACPDPSGGTAKPARECAKAYEKCTLPSGVLGVCDPVDCTVGQSEPCLICRSQH